jgi:hypothetical protein
VHVHGEYAGLDGFGVAVDAARPTVALNNRTVSESIKSHCAIRGIRIHGWTDEGVLSQCVSSATLSLVGVKWIYPISTSSLSSS